MLIDFRNHKPETVLITNAKSIFYSVSILCLKADYFLVQEKVFLTHFLSHQSWPAKLKPDDPSDNLVYKIRPRWGETRWARLDPGTHPHPAPLPPPGPVPSRHSENQLWSKKWSYFLFSRRNSGKWDGTSSRRADIDWATKLVPTTFRKNFNFSRWIVLSH